MAAKQHRAPPMDTMEQDTTNCNNVNSNTVNSNTTTWNTTTCDTTNSNTAALPTVLQLHILSFLPPNDRALSGRLAFLDAADALSDPDHCTASLSQPLPPHAVPWAVEAGQQHARQLPFWHKLQLLCTAAASGSEANLEVALALLQPNVFPELLQRWVPYNGPDPGVAAVKAGHPQLLGWLLRRCPGLVDIQSALGRAAWHCDLAGLQATWEVLCGSASCTSPAARGPRPPVLDQLVFDTAAGSPTPDAVAKMQWVLATAAGEGSTCSMESSTAAAAARSGDLCRLRWLRDRGCPMRGGDVLVAALGYADLSVAQWLVDEAGCDLPAPGAGYNPAWRNLFMVSMLRCGQVAKLRWLQGHGAPALNSIGDALHVLTCRRAWWSQIHCCWHGSCRKPQWSRAVSPWQSTCSNTAWPLPSGIMSGPRGPGMCGW